MARLRFKCKFPQSLQHLPPQCVPKPGGSSVEEGLNTDAGGRDGRSLSDVTGLIGILMLESGWEDGSRTFELISANRLMDNR